MINPPKSLYGKRVIVYYLRKYNPEPNHPLHVFKTVGIVTHLSPVKINLAHPITGQRKRIFTRDILFIMGADEP
jgi:hypothetical protein